jgi:hypothetical protein
MKTVTLEKVIELSRDSIKAQQEQLTVLDKVFVAMQHHLAEQRKNAVVPRLVYPTPNEGEVQ